MAFRAVAERLWAVTASFAAVGSPVGSSPREGDPTALRLPVSWVTDSLSAFCKVTAIVTFLQVRLLGHVEGYVTQQLTLLTAGQLYAAICPFQLGHGA